MRICDECKTPMYEGYVIDAGVQYLCDACHGKHFTPEEWEAEYADGESDSYWTSWPKLVTGDYAGAKDGPPRLVDQDLTHCAHCNALLEPQGEYRDFCSKACAWADGDDWEATERDKRDFYNGM